MSEQSRESEKKFIAIEKDIEHLNYVINELQKNKIECRPIVTGNFTKNEVMKYFDFNIHKELNNANVLHENGFFVGNSHYCLKDELNLLAKVINNYIERYYD